MMRPQPEQVKKRLFEYSARWIQSPDTSLDSQKVVRYGAIVGSSIECHQTLDRAMVRARNLISKSAEQNCSFASGSVILADVMGGSKGRFTRSWHAPAGGLWGCMVHGNDLLASSRQFIPMAVGVACCEAIRESGVDDAEIRWVNDVLIAGAKVAGFLVEGYTEPIRSEEFTLVGFGININNCTFPKELDGLAVSLKQNLKRDVDLVQFTETFLARLAWNIGLLYHEEAKAMAGAPYSAAGGEHMVLQSWKNLSSTVGREVVYGFDVITNPQYRAKVMGVDSGGGLVLRLEDGNIKTEYSGEVRYLD